MKMDKLIRQRFTELAEMAKSLNPEVNRTVYVGVTYYERCHTWATSVLNLLQRVFGESSVHYRKFEEHYKMFERSGELENCRGIFWAAKEDYEGGYLFNVNALIKAEVLDDVLEQAKEILDAGYKDPACVLAGVTIETALKDLCTRHGIPRNKLDRMNADLCKAGVYNMGMQKQITAWAARRNDAAHGNWNAYNAADVDDFIKGVTRFIAEQL